MTVWAIGDLHLSLAKPEGREAGRHNAAGRTIFQEGLPNENIPACAACHGLDGQGYHEIPRLAGQLASYTQKTLVNWSSERGHEDGAGIMAPVARRLSNAQAAAVAAYLSGLR